MAKRVNLTVGKVVEDRGLTIQEAADRCGLGYPAMRLLALGQARRVGLDTLEALCKGLECELADLLSRDQEAAQNVP